MMTRLIDKMNLMAAGGTFKELSGRNFKTLKIPLPPLEQQNDIINRVSNYQTDILDLENAIEKKNRSITDEISKIWEG